MSSSSETLFLVATRKPHIIIIPGTTNDIIWKLEKNKSPAVCKVPAFIERSEPYQIVYAIGAVTKITANVIPAARIYRMINTNMIYLIPTNLLSCAFTIL